MNWVVLLVAVMLGVLWVISLSTSSAAAWFTWLVFVAALILLVASISNLRRTGGRE